MTTLIPRDDITRFDGTGTYVQAEKKCQLHEQSQEKSLIFYIIDGKEIILDTQ